MATQERLRSRGETRGRRIVAEFATDLRQARMSTGLSQSEAARRAGLSPDKIWRVEHGRAASLTIRDACLMAAVVGLDFTARSYPSGAPIRDSAQGQRLMRVLRHVSSPLRFRTDVPLPRRADIPELRAWDAVIEGRGERTGLELESRITDFQAMTRRHNQKRSDDPIDHFVLAIADTKHNRLVMREFAALLGDLPQIRTSTLLKCLETGFHPSSGWAFV